MIVDLVGLSSSGGWAAGSIVVVPPTEEPHAEFDLVDQYLVQMQQLLPPGAAWTRERDAQLTKVLRAIATELARVHQRAEALLDESVFSRTLAMLPDWLELLGLSDVGETALDQRAAFVAQLVAGAEFTPTPVALFELAARFGVDIELRGFEEFTCESSCEDALTQGEWRFLVEVVTSEPCPESVRQALRVVAPTHCLLTFVEE